MVWASAQQLAGDQVVIEIGSGSGLNERRPKVAQLYGMCGARNRRLRAVTAAKRST
jgi:hypothetical protein